MFHSCADVYLTQLIADLWLLRVDFCFGKSLLLEAYMSTGPSRAIGSPTKFAYVCKEGNFEDTGLFYCFSVEVFPKSNQIGREPLIIFESDE